MILSLDVDTYRFTPSYLEEQSNYKLYCMLKH